MPRRGFIPKREVLPDPVYGTAVVTKLINQIMLDGKRGTAQHVVLRPPLKPSPKRPARSADEVFNAGSWPTSCPQLEVKARRVGGATYQVPIEIRPERRQTLALRWLVDIQPASAVSSTMAERLAGEIMDAANNTGNAVKRKRRYAQAWPRPTRPSRITAGNCVRCRCPDAARRAL